MAIGRTFEESFLKAVRSLEIDRVGLDSLPATDDEIVRELKEPTSERIFSIAEALRRRIAPPKKPGLPDVDPYFIEKNRHPDRPAAGVSGSRLPRVRPVDKQRSRCR